MADRRARSEPGKARWCRCVAVQPRSNARAAPHLIAVQRSDDLGRQLERRDTDEAAYRVRVSLRVRLQVVVKKRTHVVLSEKLAPGPKMKGVAAGLVDFAIVPDFVGEATASHAHGMQLAIVRIGARYRIAQRTNNLALRNAANGPI